MNKSAILLGVCGFLLASVPSVQALTFTKVRLPERPAISARVEQNPLKDVVDEAIEVHNLRNELKNMRTFQDLSDENKEMLDVQRRKYKEAEDCNLKLLDKQFKNPRAAWDKLNKEYQAQEAVAARKMLEQSDKTSPDKGDTAAIWRVGRDALVDLYQSPEKYGELKTGKSVFPVWSDQKYVYRQERDAQYRQINAYFGEPVAARPKIGEAAQYDSAEVVRAHQDYLKALAAKYPDKAKKMPSNFAAPVAVPRPLPPQNEIMSLGVKDDKMTVEGMPDTWEKMLKNKQVEANKDGEMAKTFDKDGQLKPDAMERLGQSNRLSLFHQTRQQMEVAEDLDKIIQTEQPRMMSDLQGSLAPYYPPIKTAKKLDDRTQAEALKALAEKEKQLIAQARQMIAANPEPSDEEKKRQARIQRDLEDMKHFETERPQTYQALKYLAEKNPIDAHREILDALELDKDADVPVARGGADRVATQLEQQKQVKAELKGRTTMQPQIQRERLQKLNAACTKWEE
ncbi:MAG: hypothetical protein PHX68_02060 [Alphaproteobacteria bacterium]|nr:hypothetical protein [Alphaproteobacteria bacterium]